MSNEIILSPSRAINKTRNAILRMKKCSPELRTVLRQRCQERINNDRLKILNSFRRVSIQDSFRAAFGNILREEWKNMNTDESSGPPSEDIFPDVSLESFNLDDELLLEELLEKELLLEHEDWLLKQYEDLISEEFHEFNEVVCPLCCSGYLKKMDCQDFKVTTCTKCSANFVIEKCLLDLQAAIFECLDWHDKHCEYSPSFVNIPKNEDENNLCIVCHHCSFLNVIV